jgi:G3E family GTPase
MNKTKLFIIGGFLGAGKTTSILNMAKYLVKLGKKVAIVTNDQGSDLVDTNFLLKSGLPVLEVTGGCFCCNFEEFTSKVNELSSELMPDIVLAEPVGSCTDLIATIFKPIKLNYTKQFSLGPLSIVVDPKRVKKLMMEANNDCLFPSEINYLFRKQLEEADIIVLNKIDTLSEAEIDSIKAFLHNEFEGIEVIAESAKEGIGINNWVGKIDNFEPSYKASLDIDYNTYAKAEEFLGWLNSSAVITSWNLYNANAFIASLMNAIKAKLSSHNLEIAHLKIYAVSEKDWAKASITSLLEELDFNKTMQEEITQGNLIINARVNSSPEILQPIIIETLKELCDCNNIIIEHIDTECFKPGRPNPKFRIS